MKITSKMSLQDTVTLNLKMLMLTRALKQEDLAKMLGISRPAVSQKFTGKHSWSLVDIEKAAEFFNIEPATLVVGPQGLEPWTQRL